MKLKTLPGARRGISLIEGVLYLVIALAVIIAGIVFFQQAELSRRVNDTARMVTGLHVQTRALFKDHRSFGEIPLEAFLIKSDVVPEQFIAAGTYGDRLGQWSGGSGGDSGGDGPAGLCDLAPEDPACINGTPSDEECAANPMNEACWVGGMGPGAFPTVGPRGDAQLCGTGVLPSTSYCEANPNATLSEVCGSGELYPGMCEHLNPDSTADPCEIDPMLPECGGPVLDPCLMDPSLPECGGSGDDGSGDGGEPTPTSGDRCDVTPDSMRCMDGTPSDAECDADPLDLACYVGGIEDDGSENFGIRPDAQVCTTSPFSSGGPFETELCQEDTGATFAEVCAEPDAPTAMCDHLDLLDDASASLAPEDIGFTPGHEDGGAYLWNAQSGPTGGGSDPFEIGLVIEHSWGGQVSVYGATNYFDITLWDLPRAACARLAQVNGTGEGPLGSGIAEISFENYTETYPHFPLDAAEAEQYCNSEDSNMVRIAYRKNPGSSVEIDSGSGGGGGGGGEPPGPVPWVDENNDGYHDDCEINSDGLPIPGTCPFSIPPLAG